MRRYRPFSWLVPLVLLSGCTTPEGPIGERLGPSERAGPLELTPIEFVQTEFQVRPRRVEAQEGRLRVPLWHDRPTADSIEIHFVRFPSTADDPGPPVVYLAGGPGGSGTLSASGDRFELFQAMRAAGDVIALDQRGTYFTRPYMVCPGSWDYPLDRPADPSARAEAVRPFLRRCAEHWSDSVDLAAFNTEQSADDLDDLRVALGAERLSLWGISYGTHLALSYIRRHPDRVHRAVLAGVEGPDHTYKLPANLDRVLMRVDSAIKADPRAREVLPDLPGSVRAIVDRLARQPAEVVVPDDEGGQDTVAVAPLDVQAAVFSALGEREDIVELVARAAPVLAGDLTELARGVRDSRRGNRALVMSIAMDCASGATARRLALIEEQAATAILDDVGNIGLRTGCPSWPVDDLGDDFRAPVSGAMPVLFISGTLDARTPPSNAEEVAAGFPNGHQLVIEGGSHDDDLFLADPRIQEIMVAFLRGSPPAESRIMLPPLRFSVP